MVKILSLFLFVANFEISMTNVIEIMNFKMFQLYLAYIHIYGRQKQRSNDIIIATKKYILLR